MKGWILLVVTIAIVLLIGGSDLRSSNDRYFRPAQVAEWRLVIGPEGADCVDYECDGVNDDVEFQSALDELSMFGGEILILEGIYRLSQTISRAIDDVTITGCGQATMIDLDGISAVFDAGSQSGWTFRHFAMDEGGVNISAASGWMIQNILIGGEHIAFLAAEEVVYSDIGVPVDGLVNVMVAASDASNAAKTRADYVCDGVADQVEVNEAIDVLPHGGGRVVLSGGTYSLDNYIDMHRDNVALVGEGDETVLRMAPAARSTCISAASGQASVVLANANGFHVGDSVVILDDNHVGDRDIIAIAENTITLNSNLGSSYTEAEVWEIRPSIYVTGDHTRVSHLSVDGNRSERGVGRPGGWCTGARVVDGMTGTFYSENDCVVMTTRKGSTSDVEISHLLIYNTPSHGVLVEPLVNPDESYTCSNITITDNVLSDIGDKGIVQCGHGSGLVIERNVIDKTGIADGVAPITSSWGDGIQLHEECVDDAVISSNVVLNSGRNGIEVRGNGARDGTYRILNNVIVGWGQRNFYSDFQAAAIAVNGEAIVTGNVVDGVKPESNAMFGIKISLNSHLIASNTVLNVASLTRVQAHGIDVDGGQQTPDGVRDWYDVVEGNWVSNCGANYTSASVYIRNAGNVRISANVIDPAGIYCVWWQGYGGVVVIIDNVFVGISSSYAVRFSSPKIDNIRFVNNSCGYGPGE